ncbi:tyrosine-type recombinase/integrase [Nannocystis pusilla]|uniref:tyrosine-type recombinase/integrase n=1 Tax=Nannocystis pusilla TaxID=889268 RepID=UPI003BEFE4A2
MKISTRPYPNDPTRFHVDIRFMNPCKENEEIRRRLVAPAGLDESQARAWGERQVPTILRHLVTAPSAVVEEPVKPPARAPVKALKETPPPPTLSSFYEQRFQPEYVELQKLGTQIAYDSIYRNHLRPLLGDVALADIDDDRISRLRADLLKRVERTTANMILAKLKKLLRFATKLHKLTAVPEIDKLPTSKPTAKPVYSDDEVLRLTAAARTLGPEAEIAVLLALDACLRVSEICALEWSDVDLHGGTIKVQHNTYRGHRQTPKGTIGTIALTASLRRALAEHRKREPIGPLVLYRRTKWTGGELSPHTSHSIRHLLNLAQRGAGLTDSGPHLLRHSGLTRLANLGASVYVVQAVARHARLQTTQAYLHTQQAKLTHEAAALLDSAANDPVGKGLAKRAKARKT